MDENMKHSYNQNDKSEIEMGKEQQNSAEQEKKLKEISQKKAHSFNFHQLKDKILSKEIWGLFKVRTSETLDVSESELFYRTPITNIIEGEQEYYIIVELPGLSKKNVELSLQEGILEIKGESSIKIKNKKENKRDKDKEKKKEKNKKEKDKEKKKDKEIKGNYLRREFKSPSYYRSFVLPEDIIAEGIEANFKNGVLKLIIPKKVIDETGKHVIEIK